MVGQKLQNLTISPALLFLSLLVVHTIPLSTENFDELGHIYKTLWSWKAVNNYSAL